MHFREQVGDKDRSAAVAPSVTGRWLQHSAVSSVPWHGLARSSVTEKPGDTNTSSPSSPKSLLPLHWCHLRTQSRFFTAVCAVNLLRNDCTPLNKVHVFTGKTYLENKALEIASEQFSSCWICDLYFLVLCQELDYNSQNCCCYFSFCFPVWHILKISSIGNSS